MMITLEKTEYNLNALFSFEMLKEVLFKLAKSQIKLEEEINQIKNLNKSKEKIFLKIEKAIGEDLGLSKETKEKNNNEFDNNENTLENLNENDIDNDNEINSEEIEQKQINKDEENITNINMPINYESSVKNSKTNTPNDQKEINKEEKKTSESQRKKDIQINIKSSNKQFQQPQESGAAQISPDLISKMMKQLKDHRLKISTLEKKFNSESKRVNNIENQFKNHSLSNESEFKLINDKINNLLEKNKDYDEKLENLQVKLSELDVFSMFKDNGDGTIDATKIMVKTLEEKIFKKFDLIDKRYKIDSLENLKTKSNVDNILPKLDQFNRELERINQMGNQHQEDLDNYKKENEELNNDTKNEFNNGIRKNIDELKEEIEKILNDKISLIENKINDLKNNYGDNFDILKLGLGNNDINQETIDSLDKKLNDLRKKTNDLENTLKLYMNKNETDLIKKELKDIKFNLDKKITKDDLKELYNFHLNMVDDINDLKDQETTTYDELRKTIKNLQNLQQKIESINGNIALLQKNPKTSRGSIVDFGRYIDQQKLTDTLKPVLKEFEKVYREIDSLRRDMNVIDEENKNNLKNGINKLNEDVENTINEFKKTVEKRYLEKIEFNKTIKSLEVQIKSMGDEGKKEGDSWLLAKQPLKCFNCASCEANIKNEYSSADYLPWKKYPRGEKIHRMGQGFSHMLQMMTTEFIKSIEKNEYPQDFDINSRNHHFNNVSTQFNDKSQRGLFINNKEEFLKNLKRMSKTRLPKVKNVSNSKMKLKKYDDTLPVSDDESNYLDNFNNNYENEAKQNKNSPKILKIKKKEKISLGKESLKNIFNNFSSTQRKLEPNERNIEQIRNKLIFKTEKNTFEGGENNIINN